MTHVRNRCRTKRSSGITCGRLDKHAFKRTLAFDSPIGYAVKGHTTSHAKILHAGQFVQVLELAHQDFFKHVLKTAREILMEVENLSSRLPWRMTKQTRHFVGVHSVERSEVEITQVKSILATRLVDNQLPDQVGVAWLAIRRKPHHFVLAFVDLKTQVAGNRAVEQSERMWKLNRFQNLKIIAGATPEAGRVPLTDSIDSEDRCFFET